MNADPVPIDREQDPSSADDGKRVTFHYIKSNFYRVVHVDGAIGSLNPRMGIAMSVFNERVAIPQKVVHELNDDITLGKELTVERESRKGVVREVEATLVLDVDTAKRIVDWLSRRITEVEAVSKEIGSEGERDG